MGLLGSRGRLLESRLEGLLIVDIASIVLLVERLAGVGLGVDVVVFRVAVGRHGGGGARDRDSQGFASR